MSVTPKKLLPSLIEHDNLRFVIFDSPNDTNIDDYITILKQAGVTDVVRIHDGNSRELSDAGFELHDLPFNDGEVPDKTIIKSWLEICNKVFEKGNKDHCAIGVHCLAGLGRAPVLVVIALIEAGVDSIAAVNMVRQKRKGCINRNQIHFLKKYKAGNCLIL